MPRRNVIDKFKTPCNANVHQVDEYWKPKYNQVKDKHQKEKKLKSTGNADVIRQQCFHVNLCFFCLFVRFFYASNKI